MLLEGWKGVGGRCEWCAGAGLGGCFGERFSLGVVIGWGLGGRRDGGEGWWEPCGWEEVGRRVLIYNVVAWWRRGWVREAASCVVGSSGVGG